MKSIVLHLAGLLLLRQTERELLCSPPTCDSANFTFTLERRCDSVAESSVNTL